MCLCVPSFCCLIVALPLFIYTYYLSVFCLFVFCVWGVVVCRVVRVVRLLLLVFVVCVIRCVLFVMWCLLLSVVWRLYLVV